MTGIDSTNINKIVSPEVQGIKKPAVEKTSLISEDLKPYIYVIDNQETSSSHHGKAESKFSIFDDHQTLGQNLYDIAPLALGVVSGGVAAATGSGAITAIGVGIGVTIGTAVVLPVAALVVGAGYFMVSNFCPH
jgi:hypothetical protein